MPIPGNISMFSGSFGGTDGRRPINPKTGAADENYVICDGVTTNGITVPDVRSRMIMAAGIQNDAKYHIGDRGGRRYRDFHHKRHCR